VLAFTEEHPGQMSREAARHAVELGLYVFGLVALAYASKRVGQGLLRVIPVVRVGGGAGVNKVLTQRVGRRATQALRLRP